MANVNIQFNGKEFLLSCDDGQEEHLEELLVHINQQKVDEQKKETEFSEKIDELNQETDTLLEEIDKWQM